jgi:hypothetical protein
MVTRLEPTPNLIGSLFMCWFKHVFTCDALWITFNEKMEGID